MSREEIEIVEIDKLFESSRAKNTHLEKNLLLSISERGVLNPVLVINDKESNNKILLDGFKRVRCSIKLRQNTVPVSYIGEHLVDGLYMFLRSFSNKSLSMLEESHFLDYLYKDKHLTIREIAENLSRSVSWVDLRLNLLQTIPLSIKKHILDGNFPLRNYMYDLKKFTRVKNDSNTVEKFVESVSGKKLSTREISSLWDYYHTGSDELRSQIEQGNIAWTLSQIAGEKKEVSSRKKKESNVLQENLFHEINQELTKCAGCAQYQKLQELLKKLKELL